ncbi:MAG: adenylosuccinate lyase, partial [Bacteroidales bacterium]|nr:adenylosuccinate lyase [Bacteroidales bacterium]
MNFEELTAITPIDGRYRSKVKKLELYFSEFALIKYRVKIEIEYFIALIDIPLKQLSGFNKKDIPVLRSVYQDFTIDDAREVKEIEKTTRHDVKSVEIFLRKRFEELNINGFSEFIHFGLTSQDINNTAVPSALKEAISEIYYPLIGEVIDRLKELSSEWSDITMLARTHGQPASPTRLGKEIAVFIDRLEAQLEMLKTIPFSAKFGGATGNFNAHHVAYPEIDWISF